MFKKIKNHHDQDLKHHDQEAGETEAGRVLLHGPSTLRCRLFIHGPSTLLHLAVYHAVVRGGQRDALHRKSVQSLAVGRRGHAHRTQFHQRLHHLQQSLVLPGSLHAARIRVLAEV